jgi:hypothetical protein
VFTASALGVISVLSLSAFDTGRITLRRLTPENVMKALAVDLVVMDYLEAHGQGGRLVPGTREVGLEAASAAIERIPEVSQALGANRITARNYLLTIGAIMYADAISDLPDAMSGAAANKVAKDNIELWRSLPLDVKVAAEAWKRRQQRN